MRTVKEERERPWPYNGDEEIIEEEGEGAECHGRNKGLPCVWSCGGGLEPAVSRVQCRGEDCGVPWQDRDGAP